MIVTSLENLGAGQWMSETGEPPAAKWLWHGILAPGCITLLTSQWKTGKSTLLGILLAKMQSGQPLGGLAVRQGVGLVLSEESKVLWQMRAKKLGLRDHMTMCRPFRGVPNHDQWRQLLDNIAMQHQVHKFSLLAIDPMVMFFPSHSESYAAGAAQALAELHALADLGLAVLIMHHPKKGDTREGQAARGIGVLNAEVDIVLEMTHFSSPSNDDHRRKIVAFSRFEETPRRLILELNPEGSDYAALSAQAANPHDLTLLDMIRSAENPVTAATLCRAWPDEFARPDITTLRRWLGHLVEQELIVQLGTGRKGDPFRFRGREAMDS